ncbi:oxidoreductase [Actinophytocola oryzae]|uniref:NAD(P)-dependent dehydrogenase (Short-subunit alcohol dehydrogenase family) n=1 Tax=Actinophytocola oryzae TaxID=502181 RepID=A0A4V3FSE6_9PSEU|nr:oxidoreductase [Actinophytocola oryzae]TDV47151.1 NAD(P)-dependent dehydrogenase (short-subunit alcohol dehydrogenase family) [Actinophytocola oryzae]
MWTEADIPDQTGRVALVTGANTGIGFETARALAARGATVVLACRDDAKARAAVGRMAETNSTTTSAPEPVAVRLDLASLASVRAAAAEVRKRFPQLDLLVNNAGVTNLQGTTADGFEAQFGINHLGHFALTGLLLDRIHGRIVTVSSIGHRFGRARDWESPRNAYARAKLANLLFTFGLNRRADGRAVAMAAHPGGATTSIFRSSPGWFRGLNLAAARALGRTPAMGALPTLRAATDPAARAGDYFGPDGLLEIRGYPTVVAASARAHDVDAQDRLWTLSERLTGVRF